MFETANGIQLYATEDRDQDVCMHASMRDHKNACMYVQDRIHVCMDVWMYVRIELMHSFMAIIGEDSEEYKADDECSVSPEVLSSCWQHFIKIV